MKKRLFLSDAPFNQQFHFEINHALDAKTVNQGTVTIIDEVNGEEVVVNAQ